MNEKRFRTFWANFVIAAVLITIFATSFILARPLDNESKAVNNAIYEGPRVGDSVAIMFNVYENAPNVQKIADVVESYGFNCTFFVGGSWVAHHPNTLIRLATAGFEIGNHGYLHKDHAKLSVNQNIEEIRLTERLVDDILQALPDYSNSKLFAPPSGSMGKNMFAACEQLGYSVIMWTRDTIDWRDHDEELIFNRAVKDIRAGDLILMHPTDCTLAALPKILDAIAASGLKADKVTNVLRSATEPEET